MTYQNVSAIGTVFTLVLPEEEKRIVVENIDEVTAAKKHKNECCLV